VVFIPNIANAKNNPLDIDKTEQRTVLIVDDELSTRALIVEALKKSQINVLEAGNGLEALEILANNPCDLIISDVKMPIMSGMELLNKVKIINPGIHVIMITGYGNVDLSVSVMKAGAVDFITKPFDIDELLHKVSIYLREKAIFSEEFKMEQVDVLKVKEQMHELSTRIYIYDRIENPKDSNEQIFEEMIELAIKLTNAESCAILLYDAANDRFNPKVIKSPSFELYRHVILPSQKNLFREVIRKKEPLLQNTEDHAKTINSLICVPLMIRKNIFGILTLSQKKSGLEFTEKDLSYIITLTKRASLNLENKILYESAYSNIMDTFRSLVTSVQVRDNYTQEHSLRVTELAIKTADVLNFPPHEIESLKVSGMLHDVGKIAVPDNILLKAGKLTDEEFTAMKNHPVVGESILKPVLLFDHEIQAIRHHHERWDGHGYPYGLSGYDIPLNARILSVADTFDAMTNNRPYRNALSKDVAITELKVNCDKQFDKLIVESFLKII
jgi:response regulator RpfG family c-di-GMP phosphodiesterase